MLKPPCLHGCGPHLAPCWPKPRLAKCISDGRVLGIRDDPGEDRGGGPMAASVPSLGTEVTPTALCGSRSVRLRELSVPSTGGGREQEGGEAAAS